MKDFIKTLIIGPSWVGDAVLTEPLITRLKHQTPNQTITVFAPAYTHGVYRRIPAVDHIRENPFPHRSLALLSRKKMGCTLRKEAFDEAYVLPNSWKSALIPWWANIPKRLGYLGEWRYGLLTNPIKNPPKKTLLMVQHYLNLASIGRDQETTTPPYPSLSPHQNALPDTRKNLGLIDFTKPIAIICPGAEYGPSKRWPTEYFAEIAHWLSTLNYQIWIMGSPKDAPIAEQIAAHIPPEQVSQLCGKTQLHEAIDLMSLAKIVLTNDSGLMHIAAALKVPQVAIFGSSSPRFTPPLSTFATIQQLALSCQPCFKRECPLGHHHCMRKLLPDQIKSVIMAQTDPNNGIANNRQHP